MKRDVTKPILQINGQPLVERELGPDNREIVDPGTGQPKMAVVTLRSVLLAALQTTLRSEQQADGSTRKAKAIGRIELALKIHRDDVVEMSAEEIADCTNLLAENFVPLVVARAAQLLNTDFIEQ